MPPSFRRSRASPIRRCGPTRSRAPSSKRTPGASTSAGSSSTTSTTSGSTRFTTAASPAWREASFCARGCSPASDPRACASRAAGCASEMRRTRSPSSAPCREQFQPFEPPLVHGSEVWQKVTGDVSFDAGFERLASLQYLAGPAAATRLADGPGSGTIRGTIEHGVATGEVRLGVQDWHGRPARADAAWQRRPAPAHPSLESRVRAARNFGKPARALRRPLLRARTSRGDGGAGSTCVPARSARRRRRPSRPRPGTRARCSRSFRRELPAWTRGLVDLDDFTATATRRRRALRSRGCATSTPGEATFASRGTTFAATPIARVPS